MSYLLSFPSACLLIFPILCPVQAFVCLFSLLCRYSVLPSHFCLFVCLSSLLICYSIPSPSFDFHLFATLFLPFSPRSSICLLSSHFYLLSAHLSRLLVCFTAMSPRICVFLSVQPCLCVSFPSLFSLSGGFSSFSAFLLVSVISLHFSPYLSLQCTRLSDCLSATSPRGNSSNTDGGVELSNLHLTYM